jgi:hypothetical protein
MMFTTRGEDEDTGEGAATFSLPVPTPTPRNPWTYWFWWLTKRVNKCLDCKRRVPGSRHRHNFPTCLDCFLDRCKALEIETGMVVGWGPVSDEVFRDID